MERIKLYQQIVDLFQGVTNQDKDKQVIVYPQANIMQDNINDLINRQNELKSNLEKVVEELDLEVTPLNEAFPIYNPQEEIFPVKIIKHIANKLFHLNESKIDELKISDSVDNNLISSDTIINTVTPEVSNSVASLIHNLRFDPWEI